MATCRTEKEGHSMVQDKGVEGERPRISYSRIAKIFPTILGLKKNQVYH
jgi:hypothetical protein